MISPAPPRLLILLGLTAVTAASCGYQVGGLYEGYREGVRVDIFDNLTERRTHEFELTQAVVRDMASRGIRVNVPGAPYRLAGRIRDMRTPSVVEGRADAVLVGSLRVLLEIELSRTGGEIVWKDQKAVEVPFASVRGESADTARREAFDRLARWVVSHFEKEW